MQNIIKSMLEEIGAMKSGHVMPYHKVSIVVAGIIALLFSLVFSHSTIFEGKIAVIDLDASHYSTELIQKINTSPYIEVTQVFRAPVNPETLTSHDRNLGVLYIPKGLEKSLKTGDSTVRLGYFADHSNASQNAEVLQNLSEYIPEIAAEIGAARIASLRLGEEGTAAALSPMQLKNRHLFNPTNTATNSTSIVFIYFFSSLFYGLATLMIVGRLKMTGAWDNAVFNRGPLALLCRIVPYAFFYTTGITVISALLVTFGQLRFAGNYFYYLPTIFMTGLAFGWLALILAWATKHPGEGAGLMTFLVPPGFIMSGATMAVGYLPLWAYYVSYAFPFVWQYRFYRDFAVRGVSIGEMLPTYGAYLLFLTAIALGVVLLYHRTQKRLG